MGEDEAVLHVLGHVIKGVHAHVGGHGGGGETGGRAGGHRHLRGREKYEARDREKETKKIIGEASAITAFS